ncbi:MAG: diguanylate cyclase [Deltaproteobacteria bacterium]|nr:MAG: diguanylate cyclase [Deltaproteobacteria bacterium]
MSPGKCILVVDPSRRFLAHARRILAAQGHEVHVAAGMAEGQALARAHPPEIVLVGSRLPDGDGVRFARWAKQSLGTGAPCVLLCTKGEAAPPLGPAGVDNYLVRPLKRSEILSCVRAMALVHDLGRQLGEDRLRPRPEPTADRNGALRSPLTGFYTFSYFKEALYLEVKRARRYAYSIAVLLLQYDVASWGGAAVGHADREALFGGLSVAIRRSIRETDLPVAYASEKVLILMPHTDLDGGLAVARRIRAALKRSRLRIGDRVVRPTVSMGLAASPGAPDLRFSSLVRQARHALAEAAASGGNAIRV